MKDCRLIDGLELLSLGEGEAGLCLASLPWPNEPFEEVLETLSSSTGVLPLGAWPKSGNPRRLLLFRDLQGEAPAAMKLFPEKESLSGSHTAEVPEVEMECFENYDEPFYAYERHLLRIRGFGRSVGLALGLRHDGQVHWWEACGMTILSKNDHFIEVEMGGSIPRLMMNEKLFLQYHGYTSPFLHRHNWISGKLYVRLHRNGVCEVYAHHINSKFVDEGANLEDVVPVIGFWTEGEAVAKGAQVLDGTVKELEVEGVRFCMEVVARLATPGQPGAFWQEGRFLVLQPYEGAELYGGICPESLTGDGFIFHSEAKLFPRGMARTLRFSFSLSDRSPRVVRYLAPAWWYGVCEELIPAALLPVRSALSEKVEAQTVWVRDHLVRGGFEDGSLPRHSQFLRDLKGRQRHEPGWEGEVPYALFLNAWRTGHAGDYEDALRAAYYFTDVCIDHAAKMVRMHGYAPNAFSLPMNRVQATIAAYLETGDPYLLGEARAVTTTAHWQHQNSWPRFAVGRDACYLRSAVMLYRYFGEDFFREIAREGAHHVIHSQRENGSFGDQGGGSGLHQWSGFIAKPWMGLLALGGVMDYLELFPDDIYLLGGVRRFADWLMSERQERNGSRVWCYQHDYHGRRFYFNPITGQEMALPTPDPWHHDSLARLMGFCSLTFGDWSYLEAWAEAWRATPQEKGDHAVAATLQFLPWLETRLWNASLEGAEVKVAPYPLEGILPTEATLLTPRGEVTLKEGASTALIA